MKHKVSELEGALLDAAVAKAEGRDFVMDEAGTPWPAFGGRVTEAAFHLGPLRYSTDWNRAGPLIERERIGSIFLSPARGWSAQIDAPRGDRPPAANGTTPLIAAMRAYVASKLGEEVDLP